MRLENLYENFGLASPEAQAEYMSAYRFRRSQDLLKEPTWPKPKKKSTKSKKPKAVLTEEEKVLMKLLGLKKKDMVALRAASLEE